MAERNLMTDLRKLFNWYQKRPKGKGSGKIKGSKFGRWFSKELHK